MYFRQATDKSGNSDRFTTHPLAFVGFTNILLINTIYNFDIYFAYEANL